jgi:predicted Zn-dependent protease with MMP-like domain
MAESISRQLISLEREGKEKPIQLQEILKGDLAYESTMTVRANPEDTIEQVEAMARARVKENNWFLQDYWIKKKLKEKIVITAGKAALEIYNFYEHLEEWQLVQIQQSIADYARLRNNKVFEQVRHILIDDKQHINTQNGKELNGFAGQGEAIKLYPNALKKLPHRVPGADNLEGTVIHELSHHLGKDFEQKWTEEFGWAWTDNRELLPGGTEFRYWINSEPERCVTEYAAINPAEDICESMVAAMRNPQALDPERYERLQEKFLPTKDVEDSGFTAEAQKRNLKLPSLSQPVKYKRLPRLRIVVKKENQPPNPLS